MHLLSPKEFVAELNALGCKMTDDVYLAFLAAIGTVKHKGTKPRTKELNTATGALWNPSDKEGNPLQEDLPYDQAELDKRRQLETSLLRHINSCRAANRVGFNE